MRDIYILYLQGNEIMNTSIFYFDRDFLSAGAMLVQLEPLQA